jgi:Putative zinc-finger
MKSLTKHGERLHGRVWDLLPWYANGTLAESERRSVESHLEACATCRAELDACRGLAAAIQQAPETAPAPHPTQLSRVLARIDALDSESAEGTDAAAAGRGGWRSPLRTLRSLRAMLGATPSPARWALAAQLALVLVLAGALLRQPRPASQGTAPPAFRTLADSAPEHAVSPGMAEVRVVFGPGTTEQEIRDLLLSVRGRISGGPSPLGVYTVEVPALPDPLPDVLAQLRRHRQVSLAEPVAGDGR